MTKPKHRRQGQPSRLDYALYRLRKIGDALEQGSDLDLEDRKFISNALQEIGSGADPVKCLNIQAMRGERRSSHSIGEREYVRHLMGYVAALMKPPEEDGCGLSLEDAQYEAAEAFGISVETIKKYWNNNPEMHSSLYPAPLSAYPRKPSL